MLKYSSHSEWNEESAWLSLCHVERSETKHSVMLNEVKQNTLSCWTKWNKKNVILNEMKNLPGFNTAFQEILRFAQDDKKEAQDDKKNVILNEMKKLPSFCTNPLEILRLRSGWQKRRLRMTKGKAKWNTYFCQHYYGSILWNAINLFF